MAQPIKKIGVKPEIVAEINALLQGSQAVILAEYRGLSVPQIAEIRRKLSAETSADFSVVKNTLFKRASEGLFPADAQLDEALNGPTAAVFAQEDPVAVARILSEFIATNRNTPLKIKGGVVVGKFYTAAQIDALSRVPPRDVLIAQILGSLNAPLSGLVGTLDGIVSSFVYTLSAIADQKQAAA